MDTPPLMIMRTITPLDVSALDKNGGKEETQPRGNLAIDT
jgi:hypothetical protein